MKTSSILRSATASYECLVFVQLEAGSVVHPPRINVFGTNADYHHYNHAHSEAAGIEDMQGKRPPKDP